MFNIFFELNIFISSVQNLIKYLFLSFLLIHFTHLPLTQSLGYILRNFKLTVTKCASSIEASIKKECSG